jgi:hypothetical protein
MGQKKKEQKEKKEKPLEKWTTKELREEALKIPGVQGIHGMNKEELVAALKAEKGIEDSGPAKSGEGVRAVKTKMKELRKKRDEERAQGVSSSRLNILRRKISRLRKQTRSGS